jgi:hypothetical protein
MKHIIILSFSLFVAGCAGTVGQPEDVRQILTANYKNQSVQTVISGLGAPTDVFDMGTGAKVLTWRIQTNKYARNNFIKSDERCVVTMVTDNSGSIIESIGKVDDSLGGWNLSYCKEQLGL